jgi:uncharacterized protein (DUF4415 family)
MKKKRPSWISKKDWDDLDIPEITEAQFAQMRPSREVVPDIVAAYERSRAKKGEPRKKPVSIRLSPEVLSFFKKKGAGWQTRIDDALKAIVHAAR